MSGHAEMEELLKKQRARFFAKIKNSTAKERIEKLDLIKTWIVENQSAIQTAMIADFRRPESEILLSEITPLLLEIDHLKSNLSEWMNTRRVPFHLFFLGTRSRIIYEPLGVCLIFVPWNFPFYLAVGPLVSAIAAGNCAILKPSEFTPNTADVLHMMISELFDDEEISLQGGNVEVAESLLKLPVDHIFFTGSPENGKKVMAAAANNLTSVTLELGGRNPAIVDETANLKDAAQKMIWGKFLNAGQACVAPNYVFVHETIKDAFHEQLKAAFSKIFITETGSMADCPDFGRIVNTTHYNRISTLLLRTLDAGADVVIGGEMNEDEHYISPTILKNVTPEMPVMQEEIFGPVLPLLSYKNIDDVFEYINQQEKPLSFYYFSRKRKKIKKALDATSSGSACINEISLVFAQPELPFGGVNHSGHGKAHGYSGFLAFSNERAVLKQRRGFTGMKLFYPPYTRRVKKMTSWLIRYLT